MLWLCGEFQGSTFYFTPHCKKEADNWTSHGFGGWGFLAASPHSTVWLPTPCPIHLGGQSMISWFSVGRLPSCLIGLVNFFHDQMRQVLFTLPFGHNWQNGLGFSNGTFGLEESLSSQIDFRYLIGSGERSGSMCLSWFARATQPYNFRGFNVVFTLTLELNSFL